MEQISNQLSKVEDEVAGSTTFSNPDDLDDQVTKIKVSLPKFLYYYLCRSVDQNNSSSIEWGN